MKYDRQYDDIINLPHHVSQKEYKKIQDKVDRIYEKYYKDFAKMYSNAS